ncbi:MULTISPECIES: UTRA domain-containing protein [unclassified Yoonia]|uniref:UTRA domain-containing protein n=1 Tax=unclassified Yoonia TaxID=2629118 RepID=UPI002AFE9239|nr:MULTISPECIES: UTRA domain-containing protein [unclassified Yoonia]
MDGPVTWQSVRAEALRRIRAREWPPGSQIPHEADLATEFGCARATVNRALRDLAEAGLLDRRRKGGTRVSLTPVRKATFEIAIIRHDIEARGHGYGYQLLSDTCDRPPDTIRKALKLDDTTRMRAVQALHLADGQPFCLEMRWINPALVSADVSFETTSANEWLVRNMSYSGGDFIFYATPADDALAKVLDCAQGAALFAIDRTTFSEQHPITAVTLTYAPGYRMFTQV